MTSVASILTAPWNAAFAAKAGAIAAALAIGLAMTLASAEASDEWGDDVAASGEVDGTLSDVLGDVDGAIVQIGTDLGGGAVTVSFVDNVAFDGPGADIRVHTLDSDFPATATIEVSADGVTFVSAGVFSDDAGDIDIDLNTLGLSIATAIRITHVGGDLPGFDLDAVTALNQIDIENLLIELAPQIDSSPGFTEHAVTATLTGIPATEGVPIDFEVIAGGPNASVAGTALTDATSVAGFAWTGENGPGIDVVEAWLDINGNGSRDAGEPFDTAVHQWFGVTGTIELLDVDGGGLVVGDLVAVTVDDRDLDLTDAPDTVDVTVASDSDPVGITVTLTETGDHTGVFIAVVELGATSDAPSGVLAAVDGDTITGSYDDAFDGEGENPEPVTASLIVGDIEEQGAKATICHRPPGNPGNQKTLSVGGSAVPAHLGHGDAIGECGESDVLSKQEEQQELKEARDAEREQAKLDREADREQDRLDRDEDRLNRESDRNAAFCEQKPDHQRCADEE